MGRDGLSSVLVLPDGRRIAHPRPVVRGDFLELGDGLYFVTTAGVGTVRADGRAVVLAMVSHVRS